jgi:hypothetical protein
MRRRFRVGDVVTWGNGSLAHEVVEVRPDGVVVDSTSSGSGEPLGGGKLATFVPFAQGSARERGANGPPRLAAPRPRSR